LNIRRDSPCENRIVLSGGFLLSVNLKSEYMQLFILNRTNERQTKSVGRILLYALLFFIVTRIAVMLMLTGCTAIYMANTGINPMQGLSFFGNPSVAAAGMGGHCRTCCS
jgi:hypothetical protein